MICQRRGALQVFSKHSDIPEAKGLFNPENDKDACGVGFIADLSKEPSRKTVSDALEMLLLNETLVSNCLPRVTMLSV
ncbi:hypothetical protein Ndes2526B_g09651 [Nannochloris sp. 'desiccata']